jgi:hypothetical protein
MQPLQDLRRNYRRRAGIIPQVKVGGKINKPTEDTEGHTEYSPCISVNSVDIYFTSIFFRSSITATGLGSVEYSIAR